MIYAVALGALVPTVCLAKALSVLRPIPAVAPAKTNVMPELAVAVGRWSPVSS